MATSRRAQRPLGSIRNSLTESTMPKFPPLKNSSPQSTENSLDGVSGNALSTGGDRQSNERDSRNVNRNPRLGKSPVRSTPSQRSENNQRGNSEAHDKKEHREALAREKALKQDVMTLKKTVEDLEADVKEKHGKIQQLADKIAKPNPDYKTLYEHEKEEHTSTKNVLNNIQSDLAQKIKEIENMENTHKAEVQNLTEKAAQKLTELCTEKDAQIADKDSRLQRMKSQMADTLKGNSWERQQQLDELSKELTRAQEEIDLLRNKLRNVSKNKSNASCTNCENLQTKVSQTQKTLAERDNIIQELRAVCGRFERQLKQNGELTKLHGATNKGQKMTTVHK